MAIHRDSLGNVYKALPTKKPTPGRKKTKRHNLLRSAKNKRLGKYDRQRVRTEANKKRRLERRRRWLVARRAKRHQGSLAA